MKSTSQFPAWQPIEAAPKDGTEVLGYYPQAMEVNGKIHATVFIQPPGKFNDGWWQLSRDFTKTHGFRMFGEPTHWMPLPEAPE